MAHRMRAHKLATLTEARREFAAEMRDLADPLENQGRTVWSCTTSGSCSSNSPSALNVCGPGSSKISLSKRFGYLKNGPGGIRSSN